MQETLIYSELLKPAWAPPTWVFGPVWSVLYALIVVSFGYVFYKTIKGEFSWRIALPFVLNLIFNFIYTSIQFGLQNYFLASIDILLVLGTIVWFMIAVPPRARWVVYINIPYLLWVTFASVLQITITYLNW